LAVQRFKRKLGELLIESGLVTKAAFEAALRDQKTSKKRIGEILVDKGLCKEQDIAAALSIQLGIPCIDLKTVSIDPSAVELIPESLAKRHLVVPISLEGTDFHLAIADPFNLEGLQDAQFVSGFKLKPYIATRSDILWAINKHYHLNASIGSLIDDIRSISTVQLLGDPNEESVDVEDIRKQSEAAPIIRIVNDIISGAVEHRGSDIHIEPAAKSVIVRVRVDGALRLMHELPKWVQGAITSRIKIMSSLDIAEKRVPQDGRIGVIVEGKKLDLRISTLPVNHGEKIVMRILDPKSTLMSVEKLGLEEKDQEAFLSLISKSQGIILVTGPTGSGKTTTLYASLSQIRSIEKNITTIEDPIEYEFAGISQVGVNEKIGRTFASVLRSILRQDPDVIMVGEMRDLDTATIAMRAALTGHLVLSTIHTNSTVATVTRLRNLGIPSYLIASTVIGIIAQRLVRVICPFCKESDTPSHEDLQKLGLAGRDTKVLSFCRGKGCPECGGTGLRGRIAIYELLVLSERVKEYISSEATESSIRQLAIAEGMRTLAQAGMEKVFKGTTSVKALMQVHQVGEGFGTSCAECGAVLGSEFVACPQCGKRVIETCTSCTRIVDPGWSHCPYCAEKISRAAGWKKESKAKVVSLERDRHL